MIKRFSLTLAMMIVVAASATHALAQEWERAVSLFNQKQYRPAIREFHAVLKANPGYWQAWYYIGASHFQLQGYEDTIDAFANYIKAAEKDEKAQALGYYFTGLAEYQLKQYDKAIASLTRYISMSERLQQKIEPASRAALARSYIFTSRFKEAIPVFTAVTAENKTDAKNFYYLGFAQQRLNQTDQAIAALNQALAISPKDVDSLALLGNIYLARSRQNPAMTKQAISVGERLLAAQDGEAAWGLLGQAYLVDQQYAKAAPLLDKFARAHADSSGAWFSLGIALSRSEQWKPAAAALEQAVKLAPNNASAFLEMGYVYESDKEFDKALASYQRAYELSGRKDESARASIDRVKQAKGQPN
jgi:tetratricopeptide (TPR) repeat protein